MLRVLPHEPRICLSSLICELPQIPWHPAQHWGAPSRAVRLLPEEAAATTAEKPHAREQSNFMCPSAYKFY